MGTRILQKLTVIVVWIVVSAVLYQCSRTDSVITNQKNPYEKEQEESTIEKQLVKDEVKKEQRKIVPQGYIRVLIKTSGFSDIYHDELKISSETGLYIEQEKKITTFEPNEELSITGGELRGKQIVIKAYDNGLIKLHNVNRAEEVWYRGTMECFGTENGIVLVNELPVEEYLYGVVPSEMPAGYPVEALKAQAISARTYTYFQMKDFAYPEWAAHIDDSTAFQVYKNISENKDVNQAVDDTKDQVIKYQDELIESFYFSTSSGRSSGYEVWKPQEQKPWLLGKNLTENQQKVDDFSYDARTDTEIIKEKEKTYRTYIALGDGKDVEYQEAWYRWEYTKELDDVQGFLERVESLASKYPDEISIESKYSKEEKMTQESEICSCRIIERASSGMVEELCIQTEKFEIIIRTQQCIREALAKNGEVIKKKDGSEFVLGELLPSAYFYFDTMYEDNCLKSMTLYGGGFGHGAGMSQNGAKCLAKLGMAAEEILKYFYSGVEIKSVFL